jgi:hypothetical protein
MDAWDKIERLRLAPVPGYFGAALKSQFIHILRTCPPQDAPAIIRAFRLLCADLDCSLISGDGVERDVRKLWETLKELENDQ